MIRDHPIETPCTYCGQSTEDGETGQQPGKFELESGVVVADDQEDNQYSAQTERNGSTGT